MNPGSANTATPLTKPELLSAIDFEIAHLESLHTRHSTSVWGIGAAIIAIAWLTLNEISNHSHVLRSTVFVFAVGTLFLPLLIGHSVASCPVAARLVWKWRPAYYISAHPVRTRHYRPDADILCIRVSTADGCGGVLADKRLCGVGRRPCLYKYSVMSCGVTGVALVTTSSAIVSAKRTYWWRTSAAHCPCRVYSPGCVRVCRCVD